MLSVIWKHLFNRSGLVRTIGLQLDSINLSVTASSDLGWKNIDIISPKAVDSLNSRGYSSTHESKVSRIRIKSGQFLSMPRPGISHSFQMFLHHAASIVVQHNYCRAANVTSSMKRPNRTTLSDCHH